MMRRRIKRRGGIPSRIPALAGKWKMMTGLLREAAGRAAWMFQVRDCHGICLFCEHYRKCKEDGIRERRQKQ